MQDIFLGSGDTCAAVLYSQAEFIAVETLDRFDGIFSESPLAIVIIPFHCSHFMSLFSVSGVFKNYWNVASGLGRPQTFGESLIEGSLS